jgi:hypothetical protein
MSAIREAFASTSENIEQLNHVIRSLAGVIMPEPCGFDRVWDITNRVCDRWDHEMHVFPPTAHVYGQSARVA